VASTMYRYDVQFTNNESRMLHVYVEAPTNTEAIEYALAQVKDWKSVGLITRVDVVMLR